MDRIGQQMFCYQLIKTVIGQNLFRLSQSPSLLVSGTDSKKIELDWWQVCDVSFFKNRYKIFKEFF